MNKYKMYLHKIYAWIYKIYWYTETSQTLIFERFSDTTDFSLNVPAQTSLFPFNFYTQ